MQDLPRLPLYPPIPVASAFTLLLLLVISCGSEALRGVPVISVSEGEDLQNIVERHRGPVRIRIGPGFYDLSPHEYLDPTCANCEQPATEVQATRGLLVRGEGIEIVGDSAEEVVIRTHAGYGILFDGCDRCRLSHVTVTGGVRDEDANAADAAVVARDSTVTIENCRLSDNIGDPTLVAKTVVGIIGVAGREGADLLIRNSQIIRHSWDGVALYRGARAEIRDNLIDGVDRARGATIGGGRGVRIGLTWDAQARVVGNLVTNYWKGIGVFVDAQAEVRENIVEDVLAWGITLWDADRGRPAATIEDNIVYRTGACGVAITHGTPCGESPCSFRGNALVKTGQNEKYDRPDYYCRQEALAEEMVPADFILSDNLFFGNREAGGLAGRRDHTLEVFVAGVTPLAERLSRRPVLAGAAFLQHFRDGTLQDLVTPHVETP